MSVVLAAVLAGVAGYAIGPGRRWLVTVVLVAAAASAVQVAVLGGAAPESVTFLPALLAVVVVAGLAVGARVRRAVRAKHRSA